MRSYPVALWFALAGCNPTIEQGTAVGDGGVRNCVDSDGDGYGAGCAAGPDCNDADRAHHNDCLPGDTVVTVSPLDPMDDGSSGVKSTGNGGITIDPGTIMTSNTPLIWVANSGEGTLSKIDTRSMKELARYVAGPPGRQDPSRTTVGLGGDVVVGDRFGDGATKIAGDISRCVDANGNGSIDTSTGPGDVRPWGTDECVLWHVDFPQGAIARAAAFDAQVGIDGDDSSTVWVGLWGLMQMRQLDSKTGAELANVDVSPIRPYGAAIDKNGNVWVRGGGLAKIDPQHQVTQYAEECGYGLAVDAQGRPWTAGPGCVARFTPSQNHWDTVMVGNGGFLRGIAVDGKGSVWAADTDFGLHQFDENTLQVKKDIALPFSNTIGMAIDFDGMVWAISQGSSKATKIDPTTYQTQSIDTGSGPYTYSDMTGFQLRNAAGPIGKYRHQFPGCGSMTKFGALSWAATLPPGATLVVKARTAANATALQSAPWVLIAQSPPDVPPVDLGAKMGAAATGGLLELEITLRAADPNMIPILQSIALSMSCGSGVG